MTIIFHGQERDLTFQRRMAIGLLIVGSVGFIVGSVIILSGIDLYSSMAEFHQGRLVNASQQLRRYQISTHLGSVLFGLGIFCLLVALVTFLDLRKLARQIEFEERRLHTSRCASRQPRFPGVLLEYLSREEVATELYSRIRDYRKIRGAATTTVSLDLAELACTTRSSLADPRPSPSAQSESNFLSTGLLPEPPLGSGRTI